MSDRDGQSTRLEMAHVLFMDLVGYWRLSVEEQSRIDALQELVRAGATYREGAGRDVARPRSRRSL